MKQYNDPTVAYSDINVSYTGEAVYVKTLTESIDITESKVGSLIRLLTDTVSIADTNYEEYAVCDSYSEDNFGNGYAITSGFVQKYAQSFTGDGEVLTSIKLYIKNASATGSMKIFIYTHQGIYGSTSKPTTPILAESDALETSTIDSDYSLVEFTFSGDDRITLGDGTYYVVEAEEPGITWGGKHDPVVSHSGNASFYISSWSSLSDDELCFYVYTLADTKFLFFKSLIKTILSTIAVTDSKIRTTIKNVSDTITNSDIIERLTLYVKVLTETVTVADTKVRSLLRGLADTITNTDTALKSLLKSFSDTITNTDIFAEAIAYIKVFLETVTVTEARARSLARNLTDTVTNSDIFVKAITFGRIFLENIGITEKIKKLINGSAVIWTKITKPTDPTYSDVDKPAAPVYSSLDKPTDPTYTSVNKPTDPSYTEVDKPESPLWTPIDKP